MLAGGNLGEPALDLLDRPPPDLYVLELSSFQLETTYSLDLVAAAVLNVSADHLDRYASVEEYARCEGADIRSCRDGRAERGRPARARDARRSRMRAVTFSIETPNADFTLLESGGATWLARRGEPLLPASRLKIGGLHNAANALAALALGEAAGLAVEQMLAALETFKGLPHRCEWVARRRRRPLRRRLQGHERRRDHRRGRRQRPARWS